MVQNSIRKDFIDVMKTGNISVMKLILDNGFSLDTEILCEAVKIGDISVLEWLYEMECPSNIQVLVAALQSENTSMMDFIDTSYGPWKYNIVRYIVKENKIAIKWLTKKQLLVDTRIILSDPSINEIERKILNALVWLNSNGIISDNKAHMVAVSKGYLNVLKWLYVNDRFVPTKELFREAVKNSDVRIMQWLKEIGCPNTINAFSDVIEYTTADVIPPKLHKSNINIAGIYSLMELLKTPLSTYKDCIDKNDLYMLMILYGDKDNQDLTQETLNYARNLNHHDIANWIEKKIC